MTIPMADAETLAMRFPAGIAGTRIHAVGAGGSGISALLRLAHARGAIVSACDRTENAMVRALRDEGIMVALGHDVAHVEGADLVLTNPMVTALYPDHAEFVAARQRGILVAQWQSLFGYLMRDALSISVAGVHGKGTTAAMLGALAIAGGLDPTVEVGATVRDWDTNLRPGLGPYLINEADEFNYSFLNYHPRMVVLTAIEYDHPEFFPSYEAIRDAFVRFLRGMDVAARPAGTLPPTIVYNADSPGCRDALARLGSWPGRVRTFGIASAEAGARAEEVTSGAETAFTLRLEGVALGRVKLAVSGAHNVANALAAAAAATALGVPREVLVPALTAFGGVRRRFEVIEDGDVTFIDDYAHHPHAVALTLATARERFAGRRLVAVFQPTLYTRLHRFLRPFSEAFDAADAVVIVEIQPSRERDTGLIHGSDLVRAIAARPAFAAHPEDVRYGGTFGETAALLRQWRRPGDVIAVLGSGPVNAVIAEARAS